MVAQCHSAHKTSTLRSCQGPSQTARDLW